MKIVGYVIAGIFVFFGVLFIWAAFTPANKNPMGSILIGCITAAIGIAIIIIIKMNEPKPDQKVEIIQKVDLSGSAKAEEMKCKQCGAPLDQNAVTVKEGAVFVNCPFCKSTYQITEAPKW